MDDQSLEHELAAEQAYLDTAYERLDAMRAAAERVRGAYSDVRAGGTHQARLERDIAYDVTARRLAELDIGVAPLVFGRLDRSDPEAPTWYVGRLAVDDAEHTPLVIDWRAPIAEPFYRATAVAPMGVVRRRHFLTREGRHLVGLDDEIFDADASDAAGFTVSGEGALLNALSRHRTGRMGDIVATIQAEQDVAIRADLPGTLLVTGGPGTGKTAVALHRAAYLFYTHRRQLASRGVLLVGPSTVFLRYIEQVLPSLGEHDVRLATVPGLKPHLDARPDRDPRVAAIKGSERMAKVIANAVADRERVLRSDVSFVIDGVRVTLSREDSARIVRGAQRQRGTHNARRPGVVRRTTDILVSHYKRAAARSYSRGRLDRGQLDFGTAASEREAGVDSLVGRALARGEALPDGFERELAARLRRLPQVREALERMWPVLSGPELVNDLLGFRALVRSASRQWLTEDEQELLHRARNSDLAAVRWEHADVALVDEADALLGPVDAAAPRRRARGGDSEALSAAQRVVEEFGVGGYLDAATLAQRYGDDRDTDTGTGETRTVGHVLVDEAQDLTPMQWRMLARRCPSGSFTIVGDLGQASQPGSAATWQTVLAQLPQPEAPRLVDLTVNYRTPAEVMEVAARLLEASTPGVAPSRSVRSTGEAPHRVATTPSELVATAADAAVTHLARGGKVAVIAAPSRHAALLAVLGPHGAVADTADALDAPIAILDPVAAKGLEFDHVVVVEPDELVTDDAQGLRLLYVTITRATQALTIVHTGALHPALR